MIGLETNVLVRYFAQDDAQQSVLSNKIINGLSKEAPAFVSLITVCELVLVMESIYGLSKEKILGILRNLLESDELIIEEKPLVWRAYTCFQTALLDFSDAVTLEAGKKAGCSHTLTFDKAAARSAGFVLLKGR